MTNYGLDTNGNPTPCKAKVPGTYNCTHSEHVSGKAEAYRRGEEIAAQNAQNISPKALWDEAYATEPGSQARFNAVARATAASQEWRSQHAGRTSAQSPQAIDNDAEYNHYSTDSETMTWSPGSRTLRLQRPECDDCDAGMTDEVCGECNGSLKSSLGTKCYHCKGNGRAKCTHCGNSSLTDTVPIQVLRDTPIRVTTQDRDASFNEQYLGGNSLWSVTDYGKTWNACDDERVLADVKKDLLHNRTQACKLVVSEDGFGRSATVAPGIVIIVNRDGFSVRADTPKSLVQAQEELGYDQALKVGNTFDVLAHDRG